MAKSIEVSTQLGERPQEPHSGVGGTPIEATPEVSEVPAAVPETTWRPVARSRAYELVIKRVEEQIVSGALRVGDRLPAERDLAGMLGVSRAAVREAMRALAAHGVVRAGVGVGPDGGTVLTSMPSEALTQMLRLHIALANFPMADVIEARVMLERRSARLAAQQGSDEDICTVGALMQAMEDAREDRVVFNEIDTRFHVAIAEAGRNRLVADMTTAIRDSMRGMILSSFQANSDWEELVAVLLTQHRAVYDAIAARDGAGAADAVEFHIRYAYDHLDWERTGLTANA